MDLLCDKVAGVGYDNVIQVAKILAKREKAPGTFPDAFSFKLNQRLYRSVFALVFGFINQSIGLNPWHHAT